MRAMVEIESVLLLGLRISKFLDEGQASNGMGAAFKAYATKVCYNAILIARECMGGDGILQENRAIKALMDIQTIVTGEGTYEINVLVAGKELTGHSAFL